MAKNEEGSLTRAFFHSFQANFKQATKIWLILLTLGIALALDGYVFYHMRFENVLWTIGTAVFFVSLVRRSSLFLYNSLVFGGFPVDQACLRMNRAEIEGRFLDSGHQQIHRGKSHDLTVDVDCGFHALRTGYPPSSRRFTGDRAG